MRVGSSPVADCGAHVDQFWEERVVERTFEKRHARRSARARLVTDDALDRFQVPEPPKLKALLHVDELFAHVVRVPPMLRVVVNRLEHGYEIRIALIGLREIALDARPRHREPTTRQVA